MPMLSEGALQGHAFVGSSPDTMYTADTAAFPGPSRNNDGTVPHVSVVIPTRNRPLLLTRAVFSALSQSFESIEVIVVVDGPDEETLQALSQIDDERLHVLSLPTNVGGSKARNLGVACSTGKWVAFLDDDDEWLPAKLITQVGVAESIGGEHVFVASRFIERSESNDRVLPARLPSHEEKFSEYMFCRQGWKSGETFLQTSTWLVSRKLFDEVGFTVGLARCQDLDWLLHATALPTTKVIVIPEVLAIFHHDERAMRVSRKSDWKFLYRWMVLNRLLMSAKSQAFFIATFCAPAAAKQKENAKTLLFLFRECVSTGEADARCLALFLICWFMPEHRRRQLRFGLDLMMNTNPLNMLNSLSAPHRKVGH